MRDAISAHRRNAHHRKSSSLSLKQQISSKQMSNNSVEIADGKETTKHLEKDRKSSSKRNVLIYQSKERNEMSRLEELRNKLKSDGSSLKPSAFSRKREKKSPEKNTMNPTNSWRDILAAAKKMYGEDVQQEPNSEMLTDKFSRTHSYLRISLGERCNLRCLYCMPPDGVPLQPEEKLLNASEIDRLVALFTAGGVNKVRMLCNVM